MKTTTTYFPTKILSLLAATALAAACGGNPSGSTTGGNGTGTSTSGTTGNASTTTSGPGGTTGSATATASATTGSATATTGATTGSASATATTGSATAGNTTGATGSTTGSSCVMNAGSCANGKTCCGGLMCNDVNICAPISSTATSGTGTTTGGTSGDPCPLSALDGGCTTTMDCATGLVCTSLTGGPGSCQTPVVAMTGCEPAGHAASATQPCCESNVAGGCANFVTCGTVGATCAVQTDCCNDFFCDAGTCAPSCGGNQAICNTDSDCCLDQGYSCAPASATGLSVNICLQGGLASQNDPAMPGYTLSCLPFPLCQVFDGGPGEIECQLGAGCDLWGSEDAGTGDPCAASGLTCDTTTSATAGFGVCDLPSANNGGSCIPGAAPCADVPNSTATEECLTGVFQNSVTGQALNICAQPCKASADCVDPTFTCITQNSIDVCYYAMCNGTLGTCNSEGTGDGVCAPLGAFGNSSFPGLCIQAALDGGGPGTLCNIGGNRQIGGLCDNQDFCSTGICEPYCNSGTAGGNACPMGMTCVGAVGFWEVSDPTDFGQCVTTCDFTQLDGGGCGMSSASVPTKCIPGEILNYGSPSVGSGIVDFCTGLSPTAPAIGEECSSNGGGDFIDPCGVGALCLGNVGSPSYCMPLCENGQIGQVGAAGGCPTGVACTAINFTGTNSTHTGYCAIPTGVTTTTTSSSSSGTTTGASTTGSTTAGTTTGGSTTGATTGSTTTGGTTAGSTTTGGTTTGTTTGSTTTSGTTT